MAKLTPYDVNKTHAIRLPTEADGFTKEEIAAIVAKRNERQAARSTCVGDK